MEPLPRTDVGAGGLAGALTVLVMLAMGGEFDFQLVAASFAALIAFLAGYVAERYKPFFAAAGAAGGSLLAALVGYLFFSQPVEATVTSSAIAALVVALVTYVVPPYQASPLDQQSYPPSDR